MAGDKMKCDKCPRQLPHKKFKTKYGCLWCDFKYHLDIIKEKNIRILRAEMGVYQ